MIKEISDGDVENGKTVVYNHLVSPLTREGALESLLFCIASQAWRWEKDSDFVRALRSSSNGTKTKDGYASFDVLTNSELVNTIAKDGGFRFHHEGRFQPSISHFTKASENWWDKIKDADAETRDQFSNAVKYLGYKTFSFWNICLGGKDLLAIDVHVAGWLRKLGVNLDVYYSISKPREKGDQKVRKTPNRDDYVRIESEARKLFSTDERFILPEGKVDMALVDGVLWGERASRERRQLSFGWHSEWQRLPYSKLRGSSS